MALFKADKHLIASHMPLFSAPHTHQVLIEIEATQKATVVIDQLLDSKYLVTIVPEVLDLHKIMNGSLKVFTAEVFKGHFERGGGKSLGNVKFSVKRVLLATSMEAADNGEYYLVDLNQQHSLLVHKIGSKPSFDQVVLVKGKFSSSVSPIKLTDMNPITAEQSHLVKDRTSLLFVKTLYLETKDFQVN